MVLKLSCSCGNVLNVLRGIVVGHFDDGFIIVSCSVVSPCTEYQRAMMSANVCVQ